MTETAVQGTAAWQAAGAWRRRLLAGLTLAPTVLAAGFLAETLPQQGGTPLEIVLIVIFAILFGWICLGFWTAFFGFVTLLLGDRHAITRTLPETQDGELATKTAVIMPIYNEDPRRVFRGLGATYESLAASGQLESFEFYVLSDSSDPDKWVEEEVEWARLCKRLGAFERIHYRLRRNNIKRKSGNVADFCRRWGSQYEYMVVLDADSIMSGDTVVKLVRLMERNPAAGIVQTAPVGVNRESLFARVQQLATRVYGPMFAAGLHAWQLGEAHYWGHNAIIRVAPFMAHCGLPRLKRRGIFAGEISSHDFVEAALMRRGGWQVWIAYDLPGSFEEPPATLPDDLKRDRRWCQGNLQHLGVVLSEGLHPVHRTLFMNGVMAYVSAPLWLAFLVLSSVSAVQQAFTPIAYFSAESGLFPKWPVSYETQALTLFVFTMCLLFLPKALAIALVWRRRAEVALFGGRGRLVASVVCESVLSMLIAPIRMLIHSKFVFLTLAGRTVGWGSQQRGDHNLTWGTALACFGGETALIVAWGASIYWLAPGFYWWLMPVMIGVVLAVPIVVYTGRMSSGRACRRWGLFLTPAEADPPPELRAVREAIDDGPRPGFAEAIFDPYVNALHVWLLSRDVKRALSRPTRHQALQDKLAAEGPAALSARERRALLCDATAVAALHFRMREQGAPASTRRAGWLDEDAASRHRRERAANDDSLPSVSG